MRKMVLFLAVAAVAVVISGCASIVTTDKLNNQTLCPGEKNVAHVNTSNWGIYVLSIPILTGSSDDVGSIAIMKDTVNVPTAVDMATKKAHDLGATKTTDLTSHYSNFWIAPLFVVFIRSVEVSGNAVK